MSFPYSFPNTVAFPGVIIGTGGWETLKLPEEATMLWLQLFGCGGAGGSGFSGIAGSARGGGAGGSSGAMTGIFMPINRLVSRTIHAFLPVSGDIAWISTYPDVAQVIPYGIISADNGNNGGNGTGSAGGNAVSGGTVMATTAAAYQNFGYINTNSGITSAGGGAHTGAAGTNKAFQDNSSVDFFICAGAGGGGTTSADFAGGNVAPSSVTDYPTSFGGAAGSNNGADGIYRFTKAFPVYSTAGAGGGSSNTGPGGVGGNGAPGSGGGGGGGGTTGGAGGVGGQAFAVVSMG